MVSAYSVRSPSLKTGYCPILPDESRTPYAVNRLLLKSIKISPARKSKPEYCTQAFWVSKTVRSLGFTSVRPRSASVPHCTGPLRDAPPDWPQIGAVTAHNPSKSAIFVENRMNRQKYQK